MIFSIIAPITGFISVLMVIYKPCNKFGMAIMAWQTLCIIIYQSCVQVAAGPVLQMVYSVAWKHGLGWGALVASFFSTLNFAGAYAEETKEDGAEGCQS